MKKVLAMFLALVVTIGLTACGGSGSDPVTGAPKEESSAGTSTAKLNANELKIIESINGKTFSAGKNE